VRKEDLNNPEDILIDVDSVDLSVVDYVETIDE
jgi:hypothetical protein